MAFDIMNLTINPEESYITQISIDNDPASQVYAAVEKEVVRLSHKKNPPSEAIHNGINLLASMSLDMNSTSFYTGETINPESKIKKQCVWYERLDNLKGHSDIRNQPIKHNEFQLMLFRFLYIAGLIFAAAVLFFPPLTNLLRSYTAIVAELLIILAGIASLFMGAWVLTGIAVFVLIAIEDNLTMIISELPPFWANWLAPGTVIIICLIVAVVFYSKYIFEKDRKAKYITFCNESLPRHIKRVKQYCARLDELLAIVDQDQTYTIELHVEEHLNNIDNLTLDDIKEACITQIYLNEYYTHCAESFNNYLISLEDKLKNK